MPHPTKRSTKTRRKTRAAHFALGKKQLLNCTTCHQPKRAHYACPHCEGRKSS